MADARTPTTDRGGDAPPDLGAIIRGRGFTALLVFAAAIGVLVSLASWCFLEGVHALQVWVFEDLPGELGFAAVPWWWPLPVLLVAGVLIAVAVARLPGRGGHTPAQGLKAGAPTRPVDLPGILLAAVATIGLGMVLGPEAPLIALGSGLAVLTVRLLKKDAPDQVAIVLAAAGSFAAIATVFGNPLIGAIIIIEAAGLGGPTLTLMLLPGLMAAGIGSLVFTGMGSLTGLSSGAYAITPLTLSPLAAPTLADFGWTIVLALVAAVVVLAIIEIGRRTDHLVEGRPFVVIPLAALVVGGLAVVFAKITGQPANLVLFSGQEAMGSVVEQATGLSLATLALLIVFKGLAWGISLGSARGGPTFPAIFLGIVGGLMAGHLPGFAQTPAVAVLVGVGCVAVLRLPLSSVVIAVLVTHAGLAVTPLVIVGVVIGYVAVVRLSSLWRSVPSGATGAGDARGGGRAGQRARRGRRSGAAVGEGRVRPSRCRRALRGERAGARPPPLVGRPHRGVAAEADPVDLGHVGEAGDEFLVPGEEVGEVAPVAHPVTGGATRCSSGPSAAGLSVTAYATWVGTVGRRSGPRSSGATGRCGLRGTRPRTGCRWP